MNTTNILKETIVPFSRKGSAQSRHPGYYTLYNWSHKGLQNIKTGKRVSLEWCLIGGVPVTSEEALHRFHRRRNGEL